jgi:3',5'-cyclic AMP phosphodiesterase CpdA
VIGDFGGGSESEYQVAAAIEALSERQPIDGLITTGDNFYSDDVERVWSVPYGWLAEERIPVFATWGNHDLQSPARQRLVEEYLKPPGRWYSTDLGQGTLLVLDSNDVNDAEQLEWLSRALVDAVPPIVVAFHHPAFSCGLHGSSPSVVESWVPFFEEHEVSLVLNGHDHDYQRFENNGVTYVVTGGGGQPIRPSGSCAESMPPRIVADNEHNHFLLLEVDTNGIVGLATTAAGTIIDSFAVVTE